MEKQNVNEKPKTAAELPSTDEMSRLFVIQALIEVSQDANSDLKTNPNKFVKFANSNKGERTSIVAAWLQEYTMAKGYELSVESKKATTNKIVELFTVETIKKLYNKMPALMEKAMDAYIPSSKEKKTSEEKEGTCSKLQDKIRDAANKVVWSYSIQSVDAKKGKNESNRTALINQKRPLFNKLLVGTGMSVELNEDGNEMLVTFSDDNAGRKFLANKTKQDTIIKAIEKLQNPKQVASK
jgi:hypothetical protein